MMRDPLVFSKPHASVRADRTREEGNVWPSMGTQLMLNENMKSLLEFARVPTGSQERDGGLRRAKLNNNSMKGFFFFFFFIDGLPWWLR